MIFVYPPDETDFSMNGLGPVSPTSCSVTETLNGDWELEMTHPIDDFGKWRRLDYGYIVRAPVPATFTPRVKMTVESESSSTMIYKVSTNGGRLHLRKGPSTSTAILGKYAKGTKVIVVKKTNTSWYQVSTPDGKSGYMYADYLTYVRTDTVVQESIDEVIEPRLLRDQPFRIYRIVPELDKVKVYARHLFYDLLDNMIKSYKPSKSDKGATVALGILEKCESAHEFEIHSNLTKKANDVAFENVNPIDAMLGEDGLTDKYDGELARDWYDIFAVKRVGKDTSIQIREGKNLLGISYDLDTTDVVTRIMPTGEDADGKILYLPEVYVDSPNIKSFPHVKWYHLAVSDAKEVKKGDKKLSKSECYTLMRDAAKEEYEAGCDAPKITLKVDFINVADTEEYAQYKALRNIFIGDTVRVIAKSVGVEVSMRMTQYTYNCLTGKYSDMVLGTVAGGIESNRILSRQIARGSITGGKIALNSIGSGQIMDGSIGSLQIGSAAIQTAHIQFAAITSALIGEAVINSAHIQNATITSAQIANATITGANIANAAIGTAQIENASITTAKIALLSVTEATIANLAVTTAKIGDLAVRTAKIDNLAVTAAKIAKATITNAEIANATIQTANIALGTITTALIVDGAITSAKIGSMAVGTAQINDAAITAVKIKDATITGAKIGLAEIGTALIADGAITNAKIGNAVIETANIAVGAITTALIAQGAVGMAQIADASITSAKIVELSANKITTGTLAVERLVIVGSEKSIVFSINEANGTAQLSQSTIDGGALTQRSISADRIVAGSITSSEIAAASILATHIAANAITAGKIAANAVTAGTIATGAISAGKLEAGAVTATAIAADAVTAAAIAASAITAAKLAVGAVTAEKIAANAIIAEKIASGAITAAKLAAESVDASKIKAGSITTSLLAAQVGEQLNLSSNASVRTMVTDAFEAVEVGARNLLMKTNQGTTNWRTTAGGKWNNTISAVSDLGVDAFKSVVTIKDANAATTYNVLSFDVLASRALFCKGKEYTLSFEALTTVAWSVAPRILQTNGKESMIDFPSVAIPANTWTRVEVSATMTGDPANITSSHGVYLSYTLFGEVTICNLSLVEGNKSASWSPAPEDIQSQIDTHTAEIKVAKDEITLKADKTTVNAQGQTIAQHTSEIAAVPGKITAAVSAVAVGGTNLLENSTGDYGAWTTSCSIIDGLQGHKSVGLVRGDYTGTDRTITSKEAILPTYATDTELTLSGWVYFNVSTPPIVDADNNQVFLRCFDADNAFRDICITTFTQSFTRGNWRFFSATSKLPASRVKVLVHVALAKNGTMRTSLLKLEQGNKATAWSPHPRDPAGSLLSGSNLEITTDQTKLITPKFLVGIPVLDSKGNPTDELKMQIDEDGVTAPVINSPSVASAYTGKSTITVAKSGTRDYDSLRDALNDLNNSMLFYSVTINITAGTALYETVIIKGLGGTGVLTINANNCTLTGSMVIHDCNNRITINNLKLNYQLPSAGNGTALSIYNCSYLYINSWIINASGTTDSAIRTYSNCYVYVIATEVYNATRLIYAVSGGGQIIVGKCKGGHNTATTYYSLTADAGCIIHCYGTIPAGTITRWSNSQVIDTGTTVDSGSAPSPVVPPITKSYSSTASGSYQGSSWFSDSYIRQGYTASGAITGACWFDNTTLRKDMSGKTAKSASLKLTRRSGYGNGSTTNVYLYSTTTTGKSGAPARTTNYGKIGTLKQNETKEFEISAALAQELIDNKIHGLAFYTGESSVMSGHTYSQNYCHLTGAVLTITA